MELIKERKPISEAIYGTLLGSVFILILTLFSCGSNSKSTSPSKPVISVTIEPLRYFTEAIAGDNFEIVSMVPKGSSPETYDPTPQQLTSLDKSVAYLRIGYIGFEQIWMDKLISNAPEMKVFDTSKGILLIHAEGHYHGGHFHEGGVEPHVWNSAVNAKIIAHNILSALVSLNKENEAYYTERYNQLILQIEETDIIVSDLLSNDADRVFMIYHPALSYFARDYGLKQIPIEKDGKEPSPSYLKDLIDQSRKENVRIIFVQPEFTLRNAELIARETKTEIVRINPLDYDWHGEMIKTAKALHHE